MFVGTGKPRKPLEREKARGLRAQGWSYNRIARELRISPSSALHWTRDIELTPEQRALNLGKGTAAARELVMRRAQGWSRECRRRRAAHQEAGRRRARLREPLHCAGCMLYWAEGSKDKNQLAFANSDLAMIRFFAHFLRECFDVAGADMALNLNVYLGNGLSLADVERHWLDALQLPRECLRKHQVNHFPTSTSGRRVNKLPYGVCTLKVKRSTPIVQHIFGAIQEYAGFEEPRWLG